jgi:PrkA serine protein kinase-like protein
VVKFSLRSRAHNGGKNPSWTSYAKIREVIEKRIFSQVEDLLPVISFGTKKDGETEKKHGEFVARNRPVEVDATVVAHIIDRRLNPGGKSLENQQRFLRRAKAQFKLPSRSPRRTATSRISCRPHEHSRIQACPL